MQFQGNSTAAVVNIHDASVTDEGIYICEVENNAGEVVDEAHTSVRILTEQISSSWNEVLNNAIPSKCSFYEKSDNSVYFLVRIFDSKNIKAGWKFSNHVKFEHIKLLNTFLVETNQRWIQIHSFNRKRVTFI
jgi:hypothetical protein